MHGRPSRLNKDLVWPGIMQVGASAPLVEETWTVVITNITEDAESFSYEVFGSITGYDGAGSSDQDFTSSSQRVVLRAQDWMLAEARKAFDMSFSAPLEIFWRARYLCDDTVEVASAHGTKYIRTLATGLGAGPHFIRLTMGADNLAAIDYFLITRSRAF